MDLTRDGHYFCGPDRLRAFEADHGHVEGHMTSE
jgi:hypothetical protein